MPAEMPVAEDARPPARAEMAASFSKAASGVGPERGHRHHACQPSPSARPAGQPAAGPQPGAAPPRCAPASSSRLTWMKHSRAPRPVRSCSAAMARSRPSTSCGRSTEWTAWAYLTTDLAFLLCSWPTKCQLSPRPASSAALPEASWSRFSPTSVRPGRPGRRTSVGGMEFGDHDQRGRVIARGRRLPRRRKSAAVPRPAVPPARRHPRGPSSAIIRHSWVHTRPAKRPVVVAPPIGEQLVAFQRARPGILNGTPAASSWLRAPAGRSSAGVPHEVSAQADGTSAATCHAVGRHFVAAPAD